MKEKPLGIFVPKRIQKIIYPFEKFIEKPYLQPHYQEEYL